MPRAGSQIRSAPQCALPAAVLLASALRTACYAGVGEFWAAWQARVAATQAEQPHWITPLVTTTPRLEQEWRSDFVSQSQQNGVSTVNYGNGKGLELIPAEHIELIFGVPPYFEHDHSKKESGWGDLNFLVNHLLLAANEEQGNYILTAFFGATAPTGDHANSARDAILTPTIAGGVGWGPFDVQSTVGAQLPQGDLNRLGTPIVFNTAVQYLVVEHVWRSSRSTSRRGRMATTRGHSGVSHPGLLVGRLPLSGRLGLTLGAGVQIAATQYRTANHNWIMSIRLPF